jgi:hypothetical protein
MTILPRPGGKSSGETLTWISTAFDRAREYGAMGTARFHEYVQSKGDRQGNNVSKRPKAVEID